MLEQFQAITLDCWQTLLDGESTELERHCFRVSAMHEKLQNRGISVPKERLSRALRDVAEEAHLRRRTTCLETAPNNQVIWLIDGLGLVRSPDLEEDLLEPYANAGLRVLPALLPGVAEALPRLARFPLGLICNTGVTPGTVVRKILAARGLLRWFSAVIFSDEIGVSKPHERIFAEALRSLGVNVPRDVLHVGDDLETDVAGAIRAGMRPVWLNPSTNQPLPAALTVSNLPALCSQLGL